MFVGRPSLYLFMCEPHELKLTCMSQTTSQWMDIHSKSVSLSMPFCLCNLCLFHTKPSVDVSGRALCVIPMQ